MKNHNDFNMIDLEETEGRHFLLRPFKTISDFWREKHERRMKSSENNPKDDRPL